MSINLDKNSKFASKLAGLSFLIADPSSSRKSIRTLLSQIGVKPSQVHVVESLSDAQDILQAKQTQVIFADYSLLSGAGIELAQLQHKVISPVEPKVFFMLTSKDSNLLASNAADDNVDSILLKPFTFESLKKEVVDILAKKLDPTPFDSTLETAKALLEAGKNEEALVQFQKAKTLDTKSSLPLYYEGTIFLKLDKIDDAEKCFQEGIVRNPNHYKCSLGLMELLIQKKDFSTAYKIGRNIAEHHPVPLKKLPELIRLSIWNKHFEDVMEFYKLFENATEIDLSISTYISAGMAVCGLYFLQNSDKKSAIDAFRKAEVTAKGDKRIIIRIISALTTAGLTEDMKTFLNRATDEVKNSPDLKIAQMDFFIQTDDKFKAAELANQLIREKVKNIKVYQVSITLAIELKRKSEIIKELIDQAIADFPEHKLEFEKFYSKMGDDSTQQ